MFERTFFAKTRNNEMEEIMERLAILILHEMEKNNQSCLRFSELCGVGKDVVGGIINRKKKDVKLSTIINICENSDIKLEDIFSDTNKENDVIKKINNSYFFMDGKRFSIELRES